MQIAVRDSTEPTPPCVADYLASLNAEQPAAVEHGDGTAAGSLLVIAGAGSGKTDTLAHRVAHLIVKGADPRRVPLMTFSRRATHAAPLRAHLVATALASRRRAGTAARYPRRPQGEDARHVAVGVIAHAA